MRLIFCKTALLILCISLSFSASAQEKNQKAHYRGIFQLGYMASLGTNGENRIPIDIINGCQFNKIFYLGLGTGLRYYSWGINHTYALPVYLNTRVNFSKRSNAAFFSLNLGYTINASNKFEDIGLLVSPLIGVNIPGNDHISFNFGAGIEMQAYYTWDNFYYSYDKVLKWNKALCAFVGINF
jgi:hypothetical protein